MCGICGVVQVGGPSRPVISPEQLRVMTDVMTHRGPNDRGMHIADGIALGVRRLGIKPLYFAQSDGLLVFASELKSLLASRLVDPQLDYEAIDAFLTLGFVPGPLTPLKGVFKLLPGRFLVVENGSVRIQQYWRYP